MVTLKVYHIFTVSTMHIYIKHCALDTLTKLRPEQFYYFLTHMG